MNNKKNRHKRIFDKAVTILALFAFMNCFCHEQEVHEKAQWYTDALSGLETKYTQIKIAIVYHGKFETEDGDTADLRINSSSEALEAFRNNIIRDYFLDEYDTTSSGKIQPPTRGCYVGMFPGWGECEDEVDCVELENFEQLSDKKVAFSPFSNFWGEHYAPGNQLHEIAAYGAIPLLRLMPWGEPYWTPGYQYEYSLSNVIVGEFDTLLIDRAHEIIDYGKPVMVTFGVEMNGNWFPWSGYYQGAGNTGYGDPTKADGPEHYVDAFRHVVDLFDSVGANNATWYFHANHTSHPDESWNTIDAYYPGDDYIDWIGVSLYGAELSNDPWLTFEEVMDPIYNSMITFFPNKPLMLALWGVREYQGQ